MNIKMWETKAVSAVNYHMSQSYETNWMNNNYQRRQQV